MREWLVTNGLGGYASLTYDNSNTRKFHGLLVASLDPPTKRWVFVTNIFDTIQIGDAIYRLNDMKGKFQFDLFPSFQYEIDDAVFTKTILMDYGKNTTVIKYNIHCDTPVSLIHEPIINSRHFYDVTKKRQLTFQQNTWENGVDIKPQNSDKTLKIILKNALYKPANYWLELFYQKDHERRDSWIDNNIRAGYFFKTIKDRSEYYIILTIEDEVDTNPAQIYQREKQRKTELLQQANLDKKYKKLVLSANNFIVQKGTSKSIIAGYHWFGDWGRDTLISLPGITLVTKQFEKAQQILVNFGNFCKKGLIPNAFMDRDSVAVYNAVDASLWYVDRVYQYLKYTNDMSTLKELWPILSSIIEAYRNGTDFDIHMDSDFLISHGPGLTWMDVQINGNYATPRSKKAVEIQALWYNALQNMAVMAGIVGKENCYASLAEKTKENFNRQYDGLYDVIDTKDTSLRPNLIFLVSLDHCMVSQQIQEKIVDEVQKNLYTMFGLRTLSTNNSNYFGTYLGDHNKEFAYHNGTVWPWLLGPFITAFIKVKNREKKWRSYAFHTFLEPMLNVLNTEWDGSIQEIFDGDLPHFPRGCINQAWSVAEILRSWVEDIDNNLPLYEKSLLHKIRV